MGRTNLLVTAVAVLAMLLGACGGGEPAAGGDAADGGSEAAAPEGDLRFTYVSPDPLGVNSFLVMGETGTQDAGERVGAEIEVLESQDPTTRAENVRAAVDSGSDVVVLLGFEFNDIVTDVAPDAPDTDFLIVDQCLEELPPNVHCAVFREYEGAYLAGVEAGLLTESNQLGAIGALDIPFLHRYTDAFAEGARSVNPEVEVTTLWVGGDNPFADPARAKEQALALAADGVDHIMAATAGGNLGVFEAAQEQDAFAYGVDVNQCPLAPGHVVDNVIKRVDVAIVESMQAILDGAESNVVTYGLAEEGLGLSSFAGEGQAEECVINDRPEVFEQVGEVRQQIIDGEVTVADPMAAAG